VKKSSKRILPPDGEGPLYKQLADMIIMEVEQGLLEPTDNLPTVRELAVEMKLSTGTIKHAYDELERLGYIEKVRGRGTFVRQKDDEAVQGKKDRAMRIMDSLLDDMQDMGFTLRDTQIFFNLKMREREDLPRSAHVVVVDCNPEALFLISEQVTLIRGAEVESRMLEGFALAPGSGEADPDLVVTTANHYETVAQASKHEDRVSRVVLSPSRSTVARLAKVETAGNVGIMTASERFAGIIRRVYAELSSESADIPHLLFGGEGAETFLNSLDTVILPDKYSRFCSQDDLAAIHGFQQAGGGVIEFSYHIDAGSLMYLEQRIEKVLAGKT